MALNLYRRHRKECEAGRAEDSNSGEFAERTLSLLKTSPTICSQTVVSGSTQVVTGIMRDNASWLAQNTRRDSAPRSRDGFRLVCR